MRNNHSTSKKKPTCRDCADFNGLNPTFSEGAPPAWCNPHGNGKLSPCMPGEIATKKICYRPKE